MLAIAKKYWWLLRNQKSRICIYVETSCFVFVKTFQELHIFVIVNMFFQPVSSTTYLQKIRTIGGCTFDLELKVSQENYFSNKCCVAVTILRIS